MLTADRYRLLEVLGRGGMGEVWRAEDTTLGREVAVKLLLERTAVPQAVERFRQEARTAAALNHPHVLAVYDFGEDEYEDRCYLVMELVEGHSLRDALAERDGPLEIDEACRIAGQAAAGLAAAHRAGVVHRDIKPGNLLLSGDGVKVADFGIARATGAAASALTTTGQVLGTLAYLAPERGMGRSAGPEADVYALGCVLYEMLCGRPPYATDDVPAVVMYQHVGAAPVPPRQHRAEVPAAVEELVLRMLAKDPAARPTAAEAARSLGAPGVDADPPRHGVRTPAEPTAVHAAHATQTLTSGTGRARRRAALTGLAAAALIAATTATGYALLPRSGATAGAPPRTTESTTPASAPSPSASASASASGQRRSAGPQPVGPVDQPRTRPAAPGSALPHGKAARQAAKERKRAEKEARKASGETRGQHTGGQGKAAEGAGKHRDGVTGPGQ
ncbi:serine/threonine-protein kinase [Streptomyces sp. NPDC053542]|uniref:serine/threonine-protein kinase n=1 Tax=Streptomyces sp. NPDC053542 TaxID=3365710 RepID=UPI0037CFF993